MVSVHSKNKNLQRQCLHSLDISLFPPEFIFLFFVIFDFYFLRVFSIYALRTIFKDKIVARLTQR